MSSIKYILPALAFAGWASAQCPTATTYTIQNQGDAGALAGCASYGGSIAVATGTAGQINIAGLQSLGGDLTVNGVPNITTIAAPSLVNITGKFVLQNSPSLTAISFPQLKKVTELNFQGLSSLHALGFDNNVQNCQTLNIQNTFLSSLSGLNLTSVNSITIANNRQLQDLTFQVKTIPGVVSLESNGDHLQANFPVLETAQNMSFNNVPTISLPALKSMTGNLGFYKNSFDTISTPNLTSIGGTLAINSNTALFNLSMPILKTINGGFQVQNNTNLTEINLPSLQTIGGAFDFFGIFTDVQLPALKVCSGAFNLQSSGDIGGDCTTFQAESGPNNVIKGKFLCKGKLSAPGNSTTNGSGGKKSAAVSHAQASSSLAGLAGFLIAVFTMF